MTLHPVDIAKEITHYPFFSNFEEPLLLQIATMIQEKKFQIGDEILIQGKNNNNLFFLRSGSVDIFVDGERVTETNEPGEILGDMSALSHSPASATVKVKTPSSFFCLDSSDFEHVHPSQRDRFQFLIYRIYANVLAERLAKTNEKAKKVESTLKALDQAKKELEALSTAKLHLMESEAKRRRQTSELAVLDSSRRNLNYLKMFLGGTGIQFDGFTESSEFKTYLDQHQKSIALVDVSLLNSSLKINPERTIGMIDAGHKISDTPELQNLNFLLSRQEEDRVFTGKSILTGVSKVLSGDIFGLHQYLALDTEIRSLKINDSTKRRELNEEVFSHFTSLGLRASLLDRCRLVVEELLMNAIYDAPTGADGAALFNHLPRTQAVQLNESQTGTLQFGCDGLYIGVSVQDPFGSLTKDVLFRYLKRNYSSSAPSQEANKGGAGRGLHQIVESSDVVVINVKKGQRTEFMALWNIDYALEKKEFPKSLQFFFL